LVEELDNLTDAPAQPRQFTDEEGIAGVKLILNCT
jgi:hypothetical protein